jgi:hypothetical protein
VTYGWIHDTLHLERLAVSASLRAWAETQPQITVEGEFEVGWDAGGDLVPNVVPG